MLSDDHKSRKQGAYWENLVEGETGQYKAKVLDDLIARHLEARGGMVLDIGCGTSQIALTHSRSLGAPKMIGMDYDPAVIAAMGRQLTAPDVEWRVADIFRLGDWSERFDLVFLLDMLHEVYSFYGRDRAGQGAPGPIDHARGLQAVREALDQVARVVTPGGGIAITDNVLTEETGPVTVRVLNPGARRAVDTFLADYPSRRMGALRPGPDLITLAAHDFCILLTQYNKIKAGDLARWNVEQLEIHQYLSESGYRALFDGLGFDSHIVIGTPAGAEREWRDDFQVVDGLAGLPPKRVTLLAIRRTTG